MTERAVTRWPPWVYAVGEEPDPRFSLANERTFLAWIRTALALLAIGVAMDSLSVPHHAATRHVITAVSVILGTLICVTAFLRWSRTERALRRREPLPGQLLGPAMCAGLSLAGVLLLVGLQL